MALIYIVFIIILDQVTKYLARINFYPNKDLDIIPGIFELTYLENRGAAFGMFRDKKFLLVGITSIVILAMIFYLLKNKNLNKWVKLCLILIIGGAIGNLIDRVYLGYVVDFFHFYVRDVFDFPVFNVADISVVCGSILLSLILLFSKE
jgi:signal peptidase II